MPKTELTPADVEALNEADRFLIKALTHYSANGAPAVGQGLPVDKANEAVAFERGLCTAHILAITRRMDNRGKTGKATSLRTIFAPVVAARKAKK